MTEAQRKHIRFRNHVTSIGFKVDRLIDRKFQIERFGIASRALDAIESTQTINEESWLKLARQTLDLTGNEISRRLGVSRPTYYQMERRESQGKISLENLRSAAEAMDCELVYVVKPKRGSFSENYFFIQDFQ